MIYTKIKKGLLFLLKTKIICQKIKTKDSAPDVSNNIDQSFKINSSIKKKNFKTRP